VQHFSTQALGVEQQSVPVFEVSVAFLVIGGGACGLTAALAAHSAGAADVLVLEQDHTPAGSTAMSYGGISGAATNAQARLDMTDTADDFYKDILEITKGQTDPALARLIADESGPALDWLIDDLGFDLKVEPLWTGYGHRVPRLHMPPHRSGKELMGMFLTAAENTSIDILTDARVETLITDDSGKIAGVRYRRPDGEVATVGAKAILLATCGFGANAEMIAQNMPELAEAQYYGHEGNDGAAVIWGQSLGAILGDMASYQALGALSEPGQIVIPHTVLIGGGFHVNADGARFHNELDDVSGQAHRLLAQPGGTAWAVYDARLHAEARARFQEYLDGEALGIYKTADSIAALAEATHLPPDALEATFDAVRQLKSEGATDAQGRRWADAPQLEPPYHAVRVTGALFHTQGGLGVNQNAQVVRKDGSVIDGLYAGGGAARSVSGPSYWGYLPGMGLCTAVTLGRVAGRHAASLGLNR